MDDDEADPYIHQRPPPYGNISVPDNVSVISEITEVFLRPDPPEQSRGGKQSFGHGAHIASPILQGDVRTPSPQALQPSAPPEEEEVQAEKPSGNVSSRIPTGSVGIGNESNHVADRIKASARDGIATSTSRHHGTNIFGVQDDNTTLIPDAHPAPLMAAQYSTPEASPSNSIVVKNAGNPAVCGVYQKHGTWERAHMYSKEGEYDGRIVQFSIFQCNISNSTKHWYISIVPTNGNPGTSSDIDFYSAPVTEHCRYLPPQDGWVKSNEGKDPSPLLVFRRYTVQPTSVHYPPPMRPPRQSLPLQKVQLPSSRHSEKPNASSRRLVVVVEEEHTTKTSRSENKGAAAERYYDAKPQHQFSPSTEARSNPLQQAYQHTRSECDPQSFEDQLLDRVFRHVSWDETGSSENDIDGEGLVIIQPREDVRRYTRFQRW